MLLHYIIAIFVWVGSTHYIVLIILAPFIFFPFRKLLGFVITAIKPVFESCCYNTGRRGGELKIFELNCEIVLSRFLEIRCASFKHRLLCRRFSLAYMSSICFLAHHSLLMSQPSHYVVDSFILGQKASKKMVGECINMLRMFAHGTWSEYKSVAGCLPQLDPDQILKLKQLTVLTLAEKNKHVSKINS